MGSYVATYTHTRMGTTTHMGKARKSCDICMGSLYVYGYPVRIWVSCTRTYGHPVHVITMGQEKLLYMYRQPIRVWAKYAYGTEHEHGYMRVSLSE